MNRNVSLSLMLPVILFGVGINCYAHEALPVIKTNELKKAHNPYCY